MVFLKMILTGKPYKMNKKIIIGILSFILIGFLVLQN